MLALGCAAAACCAGARRALIPDEQPTLAHQSLLEPQRAQLARRTLRGARRHAVRRHGMRVILCGGASALERATGAAIERAPGAPLMQSDRPRHAAAAAGAARRAPARSLSPDSGPVHMATMVGTPVIGLVCGHQPRAQRPVSVAAVVRDAYARLRGASAASRARGAALDDEDRRCPASWT